jgi:predicted nucleic acid-binding protein
LSHSRRARVFLDSNVLTGGLISRWGLDKAVLSLCAARICRLVLAEAVREEVEENLLIHIADLDTSTANRILREYDQLIRLTKPEIVHYPDEAIVGSSRHLIRHEAGVLVLLSAVASRPDWLLTHNIKHFTPAVARRTELRIGTPSDFFQSMSRSIKK